MVEVWIAEVDITEIKVDAIVCAANSGLALGCGVAGYIWRRGGQQIQDECDRLGKLGPGEVGITSAGKLLAKHVFHAVSMGYQNPNIAALLQNVTTKCLEKAEELELESIAFPALAAGRMKLAPEKSCEYMAAGLSNYSFEGSLKEVGFALLDPEVYRVYLRDLPTFVERHPKLKFTKNTPETKKMPWRSF